MGEVLIDDPGPGHFPSGHTRAVRVPGFAGVLVPDWQPGVRTIRLNTAGVEDGLDFFDATIDEDGSLERLHLTFGGDPDQELIIEGEDLYETLAALVKKIELDAQPMVLDARQEWAERRRHACWCGVMLDPDEPTCGAAQCNRFQAMDMDGLIP